MKKILALLLLFVNIVTYSQVGINTESINSNTLLHVSEKENLNSPVVTKGIIIPRLTEIERDQLTYENPLANPKVLKLFATDNSLMIYNTTEDCYNYWNYLEQEWKSLCGKLGKAIFTLDCPTDINVYGVYIQEKEMTTSNFLTFKVNVTKPGEYTITATTRNGYSFTANGTFLETGSYTVQALAQGTPTNIGTDNLTINANGTDIICSTPKQIEVLSPAATYTINCSSAIVNGIYKKNIPLTVANTIRININVSEIGSYNITTGIIDGIQFSASGNFTGTGNQTITLVGSGTPTSIDVKELIATTNSRLGSSTCKIKVVMTIPAKTILHIGHITAYGYSAYTGPSRRLLDSSKNFGTTDESIIKIEPYNHINLGNNPTLSALQTALNNKPDIVILGYAYLPSNQESALFNTYLNNKGVLVAFMDNATVTQTLMRAIFGDYGITANTGDGPGAIYQLSTSNDAILNGPFGDVRGKYWGEDASYTINVKGLSNNIEIYSYAQSINDAITGYPTSESNIRQGVTGFRHESLNLVWFGDGGFISNEYINGNPYPSNTIEPFVARESNGYFPEQKDTYGSASPSNSISGVKPAGSWPVQNAIIFANIMAWAVNQAEFNGINSDQR